MNETLLKAIDGLIDFVESFGQTRELNGVFCSWTFTNSDKQRFLKLDRLVFSLASTELRAALPSPDDVSRRWNVPHLPSVQLLGKTQLPYDQTDETFRIFPEGRWTDDMLAFRTLVEAKGSEQQSADPPDDWTDFRNGPGGPLLTVAVCKDRFGVSGKDLSTDEEAKKHRRKNPAGRGDVYRYCDVSRIFNRKSGDN